MNSRAGMEPMIRRFLTATFAVATMLSLSSCLDYEEDMIVNDDLSGQVLVTLTLPDTLISKYEKLGAELEQAKIEKRLENVSGVSLASYQTTGGRQPKITMLFKFSSLDKLSEAVAANPPAAVFAGQYTVTRENGVTKIDRKLGVGDLGKDLPEFNTAIYKDHFNGTIAGTNSGFYNNHGQDVRYRYKLTELLAQQPIQTISLTKSIPWMLILGGLAVLAAAAWYGWEYFGKKKPGSGPAPTSRPSPAKPGPAPTTGPASPKPSPAAPPSTPPAPTAPRRPGPPQSRRPGPPSKP